MDVPDDLRIIRRVDRAAGGAFAEGEKDETADGIRTREDVMNGFGDVKRAHPEDYWPRILRVSSR